MGKTRVALQGVLEGILGSRNVYFQPPESLKLKYPCIIYEKADEDPLYADDGKYHNTMVYDITVIDFNPDSEIPEKISELPMCSFQRFFTNDNLNHNVYRLYF